MGKLLWPKQATKIRSYIKTRLAADQGWRVWIGGWNKRNKMPREIEGLGGKLRPRSPQTLTTEHVEAIVLRWRAGNQLMCAAYYVCAGWKVITKSIITNVAGVWVCMGTKYSLVITPRAHETAVLELIMFYTSLSTEEINFWILWGVWLIKCLNKFLQSVKVNTLCVNLFCLIAFY